MNLWTIGFTKTTAAGFFGALRESGATRLVDVRLNNVSQLAGFAKRDDLAYFLRTICGMDYLHMPNLAPTAEMLSEYRAHAISWSEYAARYLELMRVRQVEAIPRDIADNAVLLCSEHVPEQCHRRLLAEYLRECWGDVSIGHLIPVAEQGRS